MPNIMIERFKRLSQHPNDVWQGGLFAMPALIDGPDGGLHRPHMAVWVSVAHQHVSKPRPIDPEEDHHQAALDSLLELALSDDIQTRPMSIEVNDPELADFLRARLSQTGVQIELVSSMEEIQRTLDDMAEYVTGSPPPPAALDARGVTLERMRSFADAAATFYRAKPWAELTDEDLIAIEHSKPPAGLDFCAVLGAAQHTYGMGFFKSIRQFETMRSSAHIGGFAARNSVWSLTYGPIDELPLADAELWSNHKLPVAGEDAYPCAMHFRPRAGIDRPNAKKLAFLEGLLRAIALSKEDDFDSGRWTVRVPTFDGEKEYRLALLSVIDDDSDEEAQSRKGDLDPHHLRRAMERGMANIHRLIAEKGFESADEINAFLAAQGNDVPQASRGPRTPLEQAQDIMYDAWEAMGRKRRKLARQALDICPDCADAYVLLAEESANAETACELYREGTEAGKRALGAAFFKREAGHFWGILETRPYMRARAGLAECLWALGKGQAAVSHYQDLLKLNPNDNQGLRYVLAACLLQLGRDKDLTKLLTDYDESTAQWQYIKALAAFRKDGDTPLSRKCLKEALDANPHVPEYLLGRYDLPLFEPTSFSIGSSEEAVYCAEELEDGWQSTPGALEWLESVTDAPKKKR